MTTSTNTDDLLVEIEEELDVEGYVGLHSFSWWMRGLRRGLTEDEIAEVCLEAYHLLRSRHDLKLVWLGWPPDLDRAMNAPEETPLDFDINSTGTPAYPMLALLPR